MTRDHAYRDDLAAAQLRVADLEREHAALVAQNKALEAAAALAPAPLRPRRAKPTRGEQIVYGVVLVVTILLLSGFHASRDLGKAVVFIVVAGTQGLLAFVRRLTAPTLPVAAEPRAIATPTVTTTEDEANHARESE